GAPVVLAIYTEAEVFAANGLVAALVLWLAAAQGPVRGWVRCGLLGLVAGLGLAHHVTCVLIAPVGLLGAVPGRRASGKPGAAAGLAGLAMGISSYFYMLIAPVHQASWGDLRDLSDIATMILRREYGGPAAFSVVGQDSVTGANLLAFAHTLGRAWLWAPGALGLLALGVRIARPAGETRAGWLCLLGAFLLAGPLLILRFNVAPMGIALYALHRFHLLPTLLLVVPVASGLELFADELTERVAIARSRAVGALVTVLGLAAVTSTSLPHILHVH